MFVTTTKEQLLEVLKDTGEKEEDIICFYQPVDGISEPGWNIEKCGEVIRCKVSELPERKFDSGYGAPEGEPFIAFGPKYVYIKLQYDGSEWIEPIPRHPEYVEKPILWLGG